MSEIVRETKSQSLYSEVPTHRGPEPGNPIAPQILENCRRWLARLPADGEPAGNHRENEQIPDLYSFYVELCALRQEFRKNHRRAHEQQQNLDSRFEEFSERLARLEKRLTITDPAPGPADTQERNRLRALAEFHERLLRFRDHWPPAPSATTTATRPRGLFARLRRRSALPDNESLSPSLRQGYEILCHHYDSLLEQENICRCSCRGERFDPLSMVAVEIVNRPDSADNEVVEELKGGYLWRGEVLIPAEVIVNRHSN